MFSEGKWSMAWNDLMEDKVLLFEIRLYSRQMPRVLPKHVYVF